jgi:multisubunit Na+/H+ antiporter MnhG subunit
MTIVGYVLCFAGVAIELLCCIGLLAMSNVYERLHYSAAAGYGALLIGVGILVKESFSLIGDKALLTGVIAVLSGVVLAHATGRAARIRERGAWERDAPAIRERP